MLAGQYYNDVSGKNIVLYNEEEDEYLILPYFTRFNDEYREQLVKRLRGLNWLKNVKGGAHLVLTSASRYFTSAYEEYKAIRKSANKLFAVIRKERGKIPRVVILEFTENGHPHLHVIFLGVTWIKPQYEISALWEKYGMGPVVHIKPISERLNMLKYVTKYISKGIGRDSALESKLQFNPLITHRFTDGLVLGWALGARMLSFSKDLIQMLKDVFHLIYINRLIQTQKCHHNTKDSPNIPNYVAQTGDLGSGGPGPPSKLSAKSSWTYLGAWVCIRLVICQDGKMQLGPYVIRSREYLVQSLDIYRPYSDEVFYVDQLPVIIYRNKSKSENPFFDNKWWFHKTEKVLEGWGHNGYFAPKMSFRIGQYELIGRRKIVI